MVVHELLQLGWLFHSNVPVFVGHQDIEADILAVVPLSLRQLVLLDVGHGFLGPNQLGHPQDLVDLVVTLDEWTLSKHLNQHVGTIPARIMPAAQQSTL